MMKMIVDAFGGDNAPGEIVAGCALALEEFSDIELILTGDAKRVEEELKKNGVHSRVEVVHAPSVIDPSESPVAAIKGKKDSSIVVGLQMVADKKAGAFISAGSTGAVLAGATLIVKRMPGVKRPALAPLLPQEKGGSVMLIDCGANVDCKPDNLQQFALMGSAYMEKVVGVKSPKVGLINNGAEEGKGNELTKAAYELLKETDINFAGNCEARDILTGKYDVLVADGFVGNVILKYTEGMASSLFKMLKEEMMRDEQSQQGAALLKPALGRFMKRMDYTEYGGSLLLGIDGGIIKCHGSSNAKAIYNTVRQGRDFLLGDVLSTIRASIDKLGQA